MPLLTRRKLLSTLAATSVAATLLPSFNGMASAHGNKTSKTHQVIIKNFKFKPDILNAKIGDKIVWKNLDIAPHTATAKDKSWTTGLIKKGAEAEMDVTKDMNLAYYCRFHPIMKAVLKIEIS